MDINQNTKIEPGVISIRELLSTNHVKMLDSIYDAELQADMPVVLPGHVATWVFGDMTRYGVASRGNTDSILDPDYRKSAEIARLCCLYYTKNIEPYAYKFSGKDIDKAVIVYNHASYSKEEYVMFLKDGIATTNVFEDIKRLRQTMFPPSLQPRKSDKAKNKGKVYTEFQSSHPQVAVSRAPVEPVNPISFSISRILSPEIGDKKIKNLPNHSRELWFHYSHRSRYKEKDSAVSKVARSS